MRPSFTPLVALLVLLASPPLLAAAEGGEEKVYPMPEFRVQALDGRWLDSEELRGSVVLLDFWATWCGPCIDIMPAMEVLHHDFSDRGVSMIGIAVDSGTAEEVSKAVTDYEMSYPVALWNKHLAERIQGLQAVPTYILIKPDWTVHKLYVGRTSPKLLREQLEILLETKNASVSR